MELCLHCSCKQSSLTFSVTSRTVALLVFLPYHTKVKALRTLNAWPLFLTLFTDIFLPRNLNTDLTLVTVATEKQPVYVIEAPAICVLIICPLSKSLKS